MAVNLLALASQLRGNLHSSPSGSRTRSSDANEPGNLPSGSHIPGTDIKQDAGIRSVARKGRRGDTELRRVGGEVAHVNTTEANAIDMLGPMGEAWVQSIGSGTRNPKTGLPEYHLWHKHGSHIPIVKKAVDVYNDLPTVVKNIVNPYGELAKGAYNVVTGKTGTWKPNEGKWGWFGQTDASRERDTAKAQASARKAGYEGFFKDYENENIAGIFTEDTEDDTDKLKNYTGSDGYKALIKDNSGLNIPESEGFEDDIDKYTDPYDTRKEDELEATLGRDLEKFPLQQQTVGNQLSSALFGQLTQSEDTTSKQNFAGSGNFKADFAQKQLIKDTEVKNKEMGINLAETIANAESSVKDLHEAYNQEFWQNMGLWESAINS